MSSLTPSSSGSAPESSIQQIETKLEEYIKEAEKDKGTALPKDVQKNVFELREQLMALSKSKDLPEDVRRALHQVSASLNPQKGQSLDVNDLQNAKLQIDDIRTMESDLG